MKNQTKSYIYVLLTVIFWGTVPAISKLTLKNLDFFQLTTYSLFFAAITMLIIVYFQKKIPLLKKYSKKDYLYMVGIGVIGIYVCYLLYFGSINYAMPADAQILNNTWQIFAIVFAFFFLKEKIGFRKIFALLLGFIGAYIVLTKGTFLSINPIYILGYALALGSAVTEGLFVILGKKYHFETFTSFVIYYISSFFLLLITTVLASKLVVPTFSDLLGVIYIGVFGLALPYAFIFRAMKLGDTAKVTSVSYLSPFLALIFIVIILGDKIFFSQVIGLILIVIGILIQTKRKK